MRYRLEFCFNPDVVIVHVDKQIVKSIQVWHGPNWNMERQPQLARDLFNVEGIVNLSISPYRIQIEKGGVFEWKEMISAILYSIHTNLDPDGELVETKPPTKIHLDHLGCAHEEPLVDSEVSKKTAGKKDSKQSR